ncbi:MAG: hypothetical protein J7619_11955 [Dyadobacter sp.]|uniref:hypothetical protein n=1 Tax=Dyadobacter sp. TaxID=1914288 RepID=UPI001B0F588D|nr:hypothetical protein [Dyadobacter sp.]MBO9613406.1 hypothetical protein [Dyadobacter sp.]
MDLLDYKKKIGFDISVHIRDNPPQHCNFKFYTFCEGLDLIVNNHIIAASADGNTPDEALSDLAGQLSGMKIGYNGQVYDVPELTYGATPWKQQ